jgi:hypothetical protein
MEIDIPDLDDVKFSDTCYTCWGGGWVLEYIHTREQITPTYSRGTSTPTGRHIPCHTCKQTGVLLTSVGGRLIDFLTERGVTLTELSKQESPYAI